MPWFLPRPRWRRFAPAGVALVLGCEPRPAENPPPPYGHPPPGYGPAYFPPSQPGPYGPGYPPPQQQVPPPPYGAPYPAPAPQVQPETPAPAGPPAFLPPALPPWQTLIPQFPPITPGALPNPGQLPNPFPFPVPVQPTPVQPTPVQPGPATCILTDAQQTFKAQAICQRGNGECHRNESSDVVIQRTGPSSAVVVAPGKFRDDSASFDASSCTVSHTGYRPQAPVAVSVNYSVVVGQDGSLSGTLDATVNDLLVGCSGSYSISGSKK